MKWMLVIVAITFADDVSHRSVVFDSKAACTAAGQDFVARFPQFEWHDLSDEMTVEPPVVRPHVRCLPAVRDGAVGPA